MKKVCLIAALGLLSSCGFYYQGEMDFNVLGYGFHLGGQNAIDLEIEQPEEVAE